MMDGIRETYTEAEKATIRAERARVQAEAARASKAAGFVEHPRIKAMRADANPKEPR